MKILFFRILYFLIYLIIYIHTFLFMIMIFS